MHPEVAAAMVAASTECVDMVELQAGACRVIARITGAQAGIVTSGASAGMLLGAAACLAGLDPARMNRLPEVADGRREFIVVRSQRNMYDRALVGRRRAYRRGRHSRSLQRPRRARCVGLGDRGGNHAEHRRHLLSRASAIAAPACPMWQRWRANTAFRCWSMPPHNCRPPATCDASSHRAPISSHSAAARRSADRRRRASCAAAPISSVPRCCRCWTSTCFRSSGARRRSSRRCAQLPGLPHHGIGRSCKVGKEEIIGLLVALERFAADDETARRAEWRGILETIVTAARQRVQSAHPGRADTGARDHDRRR